MATPVHSVTALGLSGMELEEKATTAVLLRCELLCMTLLIC